MLATYVGISVEKHLYKVCPGIYNNRTKNIQNKNVGISPPDHLKIKIPRDFLP